METTKDLFVKMVLLSWENQNTRISKLFSGLSDEQLMSEIAPGRNRGIYLLGHLLTVNDAMIATLGLGDRSFPQYDNIFLKNPDKSVLAMPDLAALRKSWMEMAQRLKDAFGKLTAEEWFQRHNSVSAEDFAKEPHRNRLKVLISRISHEAYHHGQLALLQKK